MLGDGSPDSPAPVSDAAIEDVGSSLGPPGCSPGPPINPADFATTCTSAQAFRFDNCERVGICPGQPEPPDTTVPPADLGPTPPRVHPQPTPTVPCADPSRPNLIYGTGSSTFPRLLQAMAADLAANDPPVVVVYQPKTSCLGAAAILDVEASRRVIRDVTDNWAFFFNEKGQKVFCRLDPEGNRVDFGASDVHFRLCGYEAKFTTADVRGPIQVFGFVVPQMSSQRAISAEAAKRVFGSGPASGVAPWTDPRLFFVEGLGAGSRQLLARTIILDPQAWWGIDRLSAENLGDAMESIDPADAEKALGTLAAQFTRRGNLRTLAFQARGQMWGYLPDSTSVNFDKINVRDGHYPIWAPTHLFAEKENGILSPLVDALARRLTATRMDQDLLAAVIEAEYVPTCAMQVTRPGAVGFGDTGDLFSFQPEVGCGCFFESRTRGRSVCPTCDDPSDCPPNLPACNYGFCEVQ